MIKYKAVTMKNFLSIGNVTQEIRLDSNGLTLILGSNTDTQGGTTRNGSGKTTILQAISYALYGQPLTKIKVDNLINNINGKGMLVSLDFDVDGKPYRIERGRKPNILKFYVDQKEQVFADEALGENRHTQEEIERLVGMSHTMFCHLVALNTYTDPFLKLRTGDQRDVIEELLGVTQISQRAETLKARISETKDAIKTHEANLRATSEANARIEATICQTEGLSIAWITRHEQRLAELEAEIAAVAAIDFAAEIAAFDAIDAWVLKKRQIDEELKAIEHTIRGLEQESDYLGKSLPVLDAGATQAAQQARNFEERIRREEREQTRLAEQAKKLQASLAKLQDRKAQQQADLTKAEADLAAPDEQACICCGQPLKGTDHLSEVMAKLEATARTIATKLAATSKEIADTQAQITATAHDQKTLASEMVELAARVTECWTAANAEMVAREAQYGEMMETMGAVGARIEQQKHRRQVLQEDLKALGTRPTTTFNTRDEAYQAKQMVDTLVLERDMEAAKENPHFAQIEQLRATILPLDYEPLNELQNLLKHQDFLLRLLTNKDSFVRKKIIDQNLSYLNSRLNGYLDKLGLPHEVRFMADLSVEITLLGRDFDFAQLSRGEMNRLNLSTSWAFRDMWESLNATINLLFVDEMLDQGTDGAGTEAALGILKGFARDRLKNVFLVSHRDELVGRIDHVLYARKENGFTSFDFEGN